MREGAVVFAVSHAVIIAACLIVLTCLILGLLRHPHQAFLPACLWLASKTATHVSYLLMMAGIVGFQTVIAVVAINAAASLIGSVYFAIFICQLTKSPTIQEMRRAHDAMAKTIGQLTEGTK